MTVFLIQRLKGMVGMGPQVSTDSPAGQWLQQYAQAAYGGGQGNPANVAQAGRISQLKSNLEEHHQIPLEQMDLQTKQQLQQVAQGALSNDPNSIRQLARWGVLKNVPADELAATIQDMSPGAPTGDVWNKAGWLKGLSGDELAATIQAEKPPGTPTEDIWKEAGQMQMWGQFGMPLLQHKLALAKDLLPRFAGVAASGRDPNAAAMDYVESMFSGKQPKDTPNLTMEELKQQSDAMDPMIRANPTTPTPILSMYNLAKLTGNKELEGQLGQLIGKQPRNGTLDEQQRTRQFGLDRFKTESEVQNARDQISLSTIDQIAKLGGSEIKGDIDVLNNKDSQNEAKQAALSHIAGVTQKMGQIQVPIPHRTDKDGKPLMFTMDPLTVQGNLNWLQKKWINPMPYLSPMQDGTLVPNQQNGQQAQDTPGMMDAIQMFLGKMVETPAQRKARENQ